MTVWLAFRDGEMLVGDDRRPPRSDAPPIVAECTHDLGALDGDRAVAVGIDPGVAAPAGLHFEPLRVLLVEALSAEEGALAGTASQIVHWDLGHRFCARCGGPVAPKRGERAKRCDACRIDYFPRIHPAVIVLIHDGDRVLLTRVRPARPWWALVAGFLEPGETLEQCAAREVREETGLAIDDLAYFGSQPWPFPHQVMVAFFARYAGGELRVDPSELEDARWFEARALPPLPPPISIARRMIEAWAAAKRPVAAT